MCVGCRLLKKFLLQRTSFFFLAIIMRMGDTKILGKVRTRQNPGFFYKKRPWVYEPLWKGNTSMPPLTDKVIWITGASSGIGSALVTELYQAGAKLILSSRQKDVLEQIASHLDPLKTNISVLPLDLILLETLESKTHEAWQLFGKIDVFIGCAGISQRAFIEDMDLCVYEHLLKVNFLSNVVITKALIPKMKAAGAGQLVYISSILGEVGIRTRAAYAASKYALNGYVEVLRSEVWEHNIKVSLVSPGFIKTATAQNSLDAHGIPFGQNDQDTQKGLEASVVAKKIHSVIVQQKEKAYCAKFVPMLLVYLKRFCPIYIRYALKRYKPNAEKQLVKGKQQKK